jgi:hypothetical protein
MTIKLADLIQEIDAFAAAKSSGNAALAARQANILKGLLDQLPDEIPVKQAATAVIPEKKKR